MLSVVVPTRNRAALLAAMLDSLTRQTLPKSAFEVLVIDNGSSDATADVVRNYSSRCGNVRYFFEREPGLHVGRHCGMLASRGEILVFADDDIEALPNWLKSIAEGFSHSEVSMVGGNNLPMFEVSPPSWLRRLWERSTIQGGRALSELSIIELQGNCRDLSPFLVWGCNFSIRKDVLLAAGGFHPDGMPKELVRFRGDGETHVSRFIHEHGMRCIFHPEATVYHKVTSERMTVGYFRQRGYNQGVSDSYTELRNQAASGPFTRPSAARILAMWIRQRLKNYIVLSASERRALRAREDGYAKGYAFHQKMYRQDIEVRAWVHKPRYF